MPAGAALRFVLPVQLLRHVADLDYDHAPNMMDVHHLSTERNPGAAPRRTAVGRMSEA
jgi:hypothetical protein